MSKVSEALAGKFTPGPWTVNPIVAMVDAFNTGEPIPICGMLWPTDKRSEAETEANADLVAVAPNMATLLLRCKPWIEWLKVYLGQYPEYCSNDLNIVELSSIMAEMGEEKK